MSLKEFRDNLGLTQNQMAEEIGEHPRKEHI